MLDIQLGRRNLSPIQRIAVAEKYRPIYEKQARENQLSGLKQNQNTVSQNSSKRTESIDVRAKLAKTAGVSTDTYSKGKKILDSDNETLKQEVLSGEKSINAGYKELTQNKEVLKDLIETNIRQRGDIGGSAKKIGLRIKELERLYEIEHGGSRRNNCVLKAQEQLAKEMDMDVRTLQNYKMLADMIPELQDWVETGILAPT